MGIKGDLLVKRGFRKNYRQEPMEAMKVVVHNNDITKALRTLKKKMQNDHPTPSGLREASPAVMTLRHWTLR